jgi:hypothetical protein
MEDTNWSIFHVIELIMICMFEIGHPKGRLIRRSGADYST